MYSVYKSFSEIKLPVWGLSDLIKNKMNNREIKFRRYHFDFEGKCYHVSEWGFINGAFASPSSLSNEDRSKAIDCQFVGEISVSTEIDGIPVWESDIVKLSLQHDGSTNFDYEKIGIVQYDGGYGQFEVKCKSNTPETDNEFDYFPLMSFEREELTGIEVVGNIHQNK